MRINIRTDIMHHAGLFGKPVLFTNWLIQGWHCYDLRGTRQSPNAKITLVNHAASHHAGTVLSPGPLKREEMASRRIDGAFCLLSGEMTLGKFCEEHDLEYPRTIKSLHCAPPHRMRRGCSIPSWSRRRTKPVCRNAPCTMQIWRRWAAAMRTGIPACLSGAVMWPIRPALFRPATPARRGGAGPERAESPKSGGLRSDGCSVRPARAWNPDGAIWQRAGAGQGWERPGLCPGRTGTGDAPLYGAVCRRPGI